MKIKTITAKATLKAHRASIAHWERLATGKRRHAESIGVGCCALCALFFDQAPALQNCDGCPVQNATGKPFCRATPYGRAAELAQRGDGLNSAAFKKAARKEWSFLKSILP